MSHQFWHLLADPGTHAARHLSEHARTEEPGCRAYRKESGPMSATNCRRARLCASRRPACERVRTGALRVGNTARV